jgi:hypothetical protein
MECAAVDPAPCSGCTIGIRRFNAEAPYSPNSVTTLCFGDPAQPASSWFMIWPIKGSGQMPFEYEIPAASTDGVNTVIVCCENAEDGLIKMGGYAQGVLQV